MRREMLKSQYRLVVGVVLLVLMPVSAAACMIPVFRYALENWPASPYEMAVLYRGELSSHQKEALASLHPAGVYSLAVATYNVDEALPEGAVKEHWEGGSLAQSLPYGLLLLPTEMRASQSLLWQGALDDKGIARLKRLIYSPLMRQICRALATGDSAVWVMLRGKDGEANGRVRTLLGDTLTEVQEEMKLPHELDPSDTTYTRPPAPGVRYQFRFSVVEGDLEAPENAILRQTLTALGADLLQKSGPIVMPVFGRGRALALLLDEDLSKAVYRDISSFLVGPCSCRVKELNPGFDLLAPFPWDRILYGESRVEQVMADLPGGE